jgi:hypothetical protein
MLPLIRSSHLHTTSLQTHTLFLLAAISTSAAKQLQLQICNTILIYNSAFQHGICQQRLFYFYFKQQHLQTVFHKLSIAPSLNTGCYLYFSSQAIAAASLQYNSDIQFCISARCMPATPILLLLQTATPSECILPTINCPISAAG